MANILILDVGNSNTKCMVFAVERANPDVEYHTQMLYQEKKETNRGHPWDMIDDVRNMVLLAQEAHDPVCGIITAFGDAFVHYDPNANGRPRFVFADSQFSTPDYKFNYNYKRSGFPNHGIGIKGVRALMLDKKAEWENIVPINIFLGIELCTSPMEVSQGARDVSKEWRAWDITQASTTGVFDLVNMTWASPHKQIVETACYPYDAVGKLNDMPILAGGLDNAFLDTRETTPYIMAGTWLVVSAIKNEFEPTDELHDIGARWMVSGNGRYLVQTVRKSDQFFVKDIPKIISDLTLMGYDGTEFQRVRVIGGYSELLSKELQQFNGEHTLAYEFVDCGESFENTAICVFQHFVHKME